VYTFVSCPHADNAIGVDALTEHLWSIGGRAIIKRETWNAVRRRVVRWFVQMSAPAPAPACAPEDKLQKQIQSDVRRKENTSLTKLSRTHQAPEFKEKAAY